MLHLAGFVLLWFVVRDLDWRSFLEELLSVPVWKYLVGLLILAGVYILKSWRWNILKKSFIYPVRKAYDRLVCGLNGWAVRTINAGYWRKLG